MSASHGLVRVPNPFMNMLFSTKVADIRPQRAVQYLRATDTMQDCLEAQHTNTVLSFPVIDAYGECLGIIDGVDLTTFLQANSSDTQNALRNSIESYLNSFQTTSYIPVFGTTTLSAVITILAPGCHRTLVFTSEDDPGIHSMFSESDLIAFLYYYLSHDPGNKPLQRVAELPICCFSGSRSRPTHSAFDDDPQSTAFDHVLGFRRGEAATATVSCTEGESFDFCTPLVAVFSRDSGALVGHVDAKSLGKTCGGDMPKPVDSVEQGVSDMLGPIDGTIGEYLRQFTPESAHTWIVPENISLRGLLTVLVKNKLHHVWVGDRTIAPQPINQFTQCATAVCVNPQDVINMYTQGVLGVVTLNDVLRWIARDNLWLKINELPPE